MIVHMNGSGRYKVPEFENLKFLTPVLWGSHVIYTSKFYANRSARGRAPDMYLLLVDNGNIKIFSNKDGLNCCLGKFYDHLSKEEKALFVEEFEDFSKIIKKYPKNKRR